MMDWPIVYAAKNKDEGIRAASRSGGVFTALSDHVLDNNGIIYGCVLTEDFKAKHIRAIDKADRNLMRGSKYIQSDMGNTFGNVKMDLDAGKNVLFSGTSCQIAGLKCFLKKNYDSLLTVDIVCHGVPSPKVWEAYLHWQEKRAGSIVKNVDFRNKTDFGWAPHIETLTMGDGQKVNSEVFKNIFYGHNVLRPSCYRCPYKSIHHPGDITIADYWGIDTAAPGFNDNKGVSLVLINTDKGKEAFEEVRDKLVIQSTRIEDSMQPPLKAPFPRPDTRDQFWHDFENKNFTYIAKKYGDFGTLSRLRHKAGSIKRKIHL